MTKNRVLDELRASERRPRAVVDLDDIPPLEVLDAPLERLEAIDAVWRAVENLNGDLKPALPLRGVLGLPYIDIADSLEGQLGTLKGRHYPTAPVRAARLAPPRRAAPPRRLRGPG